jgi:hypothetical protein
MAAVLRAIAALAQLLPQLVDLAAQILNGLTNSTLVGRAVAARWTGTVWSLTASLRICGLAPRPRIVPAACLFSSWRRISVGHTPNPNCPRGYLTLVEKIELLLDGIRVTMIGRRALLLLLLFMLLLDDGCGRIGGGVGCGSGWGAGALSRPLHFAHPHRAGAQHPLFDGNGGNGG